MIRYLRTFVVAAETASFSAAGNRLGLTQSAVSTQVRRLEEELGCVLFDRTGKAVRLSATGREVLPQATSILQLFEGMKGKNNGADTGSLSVGAISTVQSALLPKALQRFQREHAGVHVNVVPGTSIQLLTQVDARDLDIAVMIKPRLGLPSELKWIPLIHERYVGIAPAGAPTDLKAVFDTCPFIRYTRRSHGGQLVDRFLKRHGFWPRDSMELDEPAVILKMVSEGLGCSIIPGELVPLDSTPGIEVLALPGQPLIREVGILVRLAALKAPPVSSLIESLAQEAQRFSKAQAVHR